MLADLRQCQQQPKIDDSCPMTIIKIIFIKLEALVIYSHVEPWVQDRSSEYLNSIS